MRQAMPSTISQASYPFFFRRVALLALTITYLGNSAAMVAHARQQPALAPDPAHQQALLALEDVYSESKAYDDPGLRVRVKAQLADVLWATDPSRSKDMLTAAFDDTGELKQDLAKRRSLRSEVIRVASRHDRELVNTLIARLDAKKDDESGLPPPRDSFDRGTERLTLLLDAATTLLNAGDRQGAIPLARRSLSEGRSGRFLFFLSQLMEKDQATGEKLFLDALAVLRQGPADPNDLLLYGMWLFYPNTRLIGTLGQRGSGVEVYDYGLDFGAAQPQYPSLLRPYLETSADVLAGFRVVPGQAESTKSVELKRFALRQLLPLFEVYLPGRAEAMRAELNYLGLAPSWAVAPNETPETKADSRFADDLPASDLIRNIKKLPDELERDQLYYQQSMRAFNRGDLDRAAACAAEISRPKVKESLTTVITYKGVLEAIERGKLDEAEKTATAQLDRVRRAEVYGQLAKAWAERGDLSRAHELMNSASSEAGKIDDRAKRAEAYVFLAGAITARDAPKAFEFLEAAVKDINSLEKFEATNSVLLVEMQSPKGEKRMVAFSRQVSLVSVIPPLAKTDLFRAITAARSLSAPAPRALAVIAACRDVLAAGMKQVETKKAAPPVRMADKKQETKKEPHTQG